MSKKLEQVLRAAVAAAGLLVLFGCPPPQPGGGTISGKVFDYFTGEGISGVTVVFGGYSDTTDAWGNYSIDVEESVHSVDGVFAAFKSLEYTFTVCGGMSLDPTGDPVCNIGMYPFNTTGYSERNLSGRIKNSTDIEIPDGSSVAFVIVNENGGFSWVGDIPYDSASGGYSASSLTFGSDCFVLVYVEDQFGDGLFWFYLTDQDLSVDRTNYDLTQPSSGYTKVNLSGTLGTAFQGHLVVPPEGMIFGCVDGDLFGSSSASVEIYNPDGFLPMMWWTISGETDYPAPGDRTMKIHARQLPFSDSISLPSALTLAGPSETVDGTTVGWDGSTLSFDPAAGAEGYVAILEDDSGYAGMIWLSSSASVTLPAGLVTAILEPGSGWDLTVMPGASTSFDPEAILDLALHSDLSEGGIPYCECQAVVVFVADVTKLDAIP